jgi:hypothetical protein
MKREDDDDGLFIILSIVLLVHYLYILYSLRKRGLLPLLVIIAVVWSKNPTRIQHQILEKKNEIIIF